MLASQNRIPFKNIFILILIFLNLLQVYFQFNNMITNAYWDSSFLYLQRDKKKALLFLNQLLLNTSESEFQYHLKQLKTKQDDDLLIKELENEISVNNLIFVKKNNKYKAHFSTDESTL